MRMGRTQLASVAKLEAGHLLVHRPGTRAVTLTATERLEAAQKEVTQTDPLAATGEPVEEGAMAAGSLQENHTSSLRQTAATRLRFNPSFDAWSSSDEGRTEQSIEVYTSQRAKQSR